MIQYKNNQRKCQGYKSGKQRRGDRIDMVVWFSKTFHVVLNISSSIICLMVSKNVVSYILLWRILKSMIFSLLQPKFYISLSIINGSSFPRRAFFWIVKGLIRLNCFSALIGGCSSLQVVFRFQIAICYRSAKNVAFNMIQIFAHSANFRHAERTFLSIILNKLWSKKA